MDALILGAGYATRLYPLTKDRPKPLLPVGGVPIVERICRQLAELDGLGTISIVTNHAFAGHYASWLEGVRARRWSGPELALHDDGTTTPENRLGAIGDLRFVLEQAKISSDLIVVAGDNLIDSPLSGFAEIGRSKGAAVGLKDFRDRSKVSLYGVVELSPDGWVVGFEEKPAQPQSSMVAVGLYYLPAGTLPLVGRYLDEGNRKDAPGYYLQWLHRRIPVTGHVLEGEWFDIGDLESYRRADERMGRRQPGARPPSGLRTA